MPNRIPVLLLVALFGCETAEEPSPDGATGGAGTSTGGSATGGSSSGSGGQAGSLGGTPGSAGGGAGMSAGSGGAPVAGAAGEATAGASGSSGGGAGAAGGTSGASGAGPGGSGGSGGSVSDPGNEGDGDITIDAPFTPAPEATVGSGVPRGTLQSFMLSSSTSTIYPSNVANGQAFSRQVQVYLPNGYVAGTEAPFMIVQDGSSYVNRLRPVLDNMIADGRLPRLIVVFVNPGPGDGPGSQRGLEYDTVSNTYLSFVESELLPKVATDYGARFTTNPEGRASFGCSSGGAAAFTMGWFRPDLYRRIITYSGTFTNQASSATYPHGAWEYHENLIPDSEPKPLRVFLEVGSNDNGATSPASGFRNWVLANQGMARELAAKAYHYRFVLANGAGHCDGGVLGQTLPETMAWAWRGYPR
jgi:enterochelin esterase-like enzyme